MAAPGSLGVPPNPMPRPIVTAQQLRDAADEIELLDNLPGFGDARAILNAINSLDNKL